MCIWTILHSKKPQRNIFFRTIHIPFGYPLTSLSETSQSVSSLSQSSQSVKSSSQSSQSVKNSSQSSQSAKSSSQTSQSQISQDYYKCQFCKKIYGHSSPCPYYIQSSVPQKSRESQTTSIRIKLPKYLDYSKKKGLGVYNKDKNTVEDLL